MHVADAEVTPQVNQPVGDEPAAIVGQIDVGRLKASIEQTAQTKQKRKDDRQPLFAQNLFHGFAPGELVDELV